MVNSSKPRPDLPICGLVLLASIALLPAPRALAGDCEDACGIGDHVAVAILNDAECGNGTCMNCQIYPPLGQPTSRTLTATARITIDVGCSNRDLAICQWWIRNPGGSEVVVAANCGIQTNLAPGNHDYQFQQNANVEATYQYRILVNDVTGLMGCSCPDDCTGSGGCGSKCKNSDPGDAASCQIDLI